ncbi:MAG: inositol monophosphatase family protein [Candidatus Planktophila sp.]
MKKTFACAHRGDSGRFRENTIIAIQSAIDMGAEVVEIDVRITRDGKVIVLHDSNLERLWGVSKESTELDWAEISQFGHGELRIPLLIDVLALFVGKSSMLMIDMEQREPASQTYEVVANSPLEQDQIFWCGNFEGMKTIRSLSPKARIWMPWDKLALPTKAETDILKPEFINLHYSFVTEKSVKAMHDAGFKVAVWTVDDDATMRWAVAIGVDSITSNSLTHLQSVIAESPSMDITGPKKMKLTDIDLDRAMTIARDLGKWAILVASNMDPGKIELKKNAADIVTEIDVMIEAHVREVIAANLPGHNFVGEEMGGSYIEDVPSWYLDPIDGTTNFANRLPWTSFCFGLAHNRDVLLGVVIDPWRDELYEAQRGKGAKRNGEPLIIEDQTGVENPLASRVVSTELAAYQPWPGMITLLDGLAAEFCTMRIMGSGTLTIVGPALHRGVGAVVGQFSPIDHLASLLIVAEAGGVVWDEDGQENLFPIKGGVMTATQAAAGPLYKIWMQALAAQR